jgi:hypothetical protein
MHFNRTPHIRQKIKHRTTLGMRNSSEEVQ